MKYSQNFLYSFLAGFIILCFMALHAYKITDIPAGLYLDETSIGLNAASIFENGTDEYGEFFPVYFKAFGEWKNPLYIYTASGIFFVFGESEWSLRITSIFFFVLFLWGVWCLSRKIFSQKISVSYYALVAAGTLPWFFTLSRISFEVISQIATAIWFLYFCYISYSEPLKEKLFSQKIIPLLLSGVFLALFLYSYSTSRLLAFGVILALILSFYQKKYWKTHSILIATFLVCSLPYFIFLYTHSGALSARFEMLTYIYSPTLSFLEKLSIFLKNYFSAFDISNFLLFQGDNNIRHSAGFMGQVFFIPFALFLIGFSGLIQNIFTVSKKRSWSIFLLLLFIGSPIPASLTSDIHHSLRLFFFGFLIFIISLYGYFFLIEKFSQYKKTVWICVFGGIFLQSIFYFQYYFSEEMHKKTISAFGGYELQQSIEWALSQQPQRIIFYENPQNPIYASIQFYNHILNTQVVLTKAPPSKNSCQLWFVWNPPKITLSPSSIFRGDSDGIIKGVCY